MAIWVNYCGCARQNLVGLVVVDNQHIESQLSGMFQRIVCADTAIDRYQNLGTAIL